MTFAAALYAYLSGTTGITALVGTRIFPVVGPPPESAGAVFPDTLVFRLDGRSDDASISLSRAKTTRWTLISVSSGYVSAHAIADAAETALHFFSGQMGGSGGYNVTASLLIDSRDEFDSDFGLFAVESAFEITYITTA